MNNSSNQDTSVVTNQNITVDDIIKLSDTELYNRALTFKANNDFDNYNIYLVMAANKGNKQAQADIASDWILTNVGLWSKQNHSITLPFYEKSKDQAYSAHYLGHMYFTGLSVTKNLEVAAQMYELGIKAGYSGSIVKLVDVYMADKNSKQKNKKEYITNYFVNIGKPKLLKQIYGYTDAELKTIIENAKNMKAQSDAEIDQIISQTVNCVLQNKI